MAQPKYHSLSELLAMIDEPNRTACQNLFQDNKELFLNARGSKTKHQAWKGGYLDHVVEACNIGLTVYDALHAARPLSFSKSDVVLVLYLHDVEKPWKHALKEGGWSDIIALGDKDKIREFTLKKIAQYAISLNPEQLIAFKYVEGEGKDYDPVKRVMNELGSLCHSADVLSARLWYDHPEQDDMWKGTKSTL